MKTYPAVKGDNSNVGDVLKQIVRTRNFDDVPDRANIDQTFVAGRKSNRQPSASNDVINGDRVGDFFPTPTYLYILINNSGTVEWIRYAGGTW